jgi:hypothetical protein
LAAREVATRSDGVGAALATTGFVVSPGRSARVGPLRRSLVGGFVMVRAL